MSGLIDAVFGGDEPDYSGMNQAAVMSAQLGQKAFDWFTQEYERTAPDREATQTLDRQVAEEQLATMREQNEIAREYADHNRETFRPLEQRLVAEAQAYDTPERRQQEADRAVADVNAQRALQRQATDVALARSGVSPESMRSQGIVASEDVNTARIAANAAGAARNRVEATGYARMADAANLGRNLPSAQATAVQTGTQAGGAAVGASGAALGAGQSGAALMQTGFNTALAGQGQAGKIFGDVASTQAQTRGQDLAFMSSLFNSYAKMGG